LYRFYIFGKFLNTMRPQYTIVKKIIEKDAEVMEASRLLSGIGISIDLLDNLNLVDLAMDIVGFPKDGYNHPIGIDSKESENAFSRSRWYDMAWNIDSGEITIDEYVNNLYNDYDELILHKPYLFIKNESNNEL